VIRSRDAGGYGIHAQWNEDFHHALHAVLTGERNGYYHDFGRLADLAKALTRAFVYDGRYSTYRLRCHGRPATGISGHRFVGCLQNHDQVGNRGAGERMSRLLSPGRLRIGAALVLTSPFVPMLFHGEEWGASSPFLYFTDHQDAELGKAVRQGRRKEYAAFGWRSEDIPDPQAAETFERSRLLWDETHRESHRSLLDWYRRLIRFRRAVPELLDGRLDRIRTAFDDEAEWFRMDRGRITVVCNLADRPRAVPKGERDGDAILLASEEGVTVGSGWVSLPSETVAIVGPGDTEIEAAVR
jgi:maltooligosyltrehalose trehalohydrolase